MELNLYRTVIRLSEHAASLVPAAYPHDAKKRN